MNEIALGMLFRLCGWHIALRCMRATPNPVIDGELVLAGHIATVPQLQEVLTARLWRRF